MDRSFLSSEDVVTASRNFVCIRTATYEDAGEAEFIKRTIFDGADDLRNFGFCILSSNAKETIRVSKRGPNFVYSDANELASDLNRITNQYPSKDKTTKNAVASLPAIPKMKSFRLGLNVASCDGLPCVAIVGEDQEDLEQISKQLGQVIWEEELIGKFIFASTIDSGDLKDVEGARSQTGILVIKPDEFGTKGKLIEAIASDVSADELKAKLLAAADGFERHTKEHGTHVRNGRRIGKSWETEVPVPERRSGASRDGDRGNRGTSRKRGRKK